MISESLKLKIFRPIWIIIVGSLQIHGVGVEVAVVWAVLYLGHLGRAEAPVGQRRPVQLGEPHEVLEVVQGGPLVSRQPAAQPDDLGGGGGHAAGE